MPRDAPQAHIAYIEAALEAWLEAKSKKWLTYPDPVRQRDVERSRRRYEIEVVHEHRMKVFWGVRCAFEDGYSYPEIAEWFRSSEAKGDAEVNLLDEAIDWAQRVRPRALVRHFISRYRGPR